MDETLDGRIVPVERATTTIPVNQGFARGTSANNAGDRNFTHDINNSARNTGIVDIFVFPMVTFKSTIAYLEQVMPGQSADWYNRIASEITAGRMPLPKLGTVPAPSPQPTEIQPSVPVEVETCPTINITGKKYWKSLEPQPIEIQQSVPVEPEAEARPEVNMARQKYLKSLEPQPPTAKPKSKTKQLKQGTYQSSQSSQSKPTSLVPDTVGEALRQANKPKPKRVQAANGTTKWKLESLVHGDKQAASRLAAQVAFAHPEKTEQWCWEKAIYDLGRDRF